MCVLMFIFNANHEMFYNILLHIRETKEWIGLVLSINCTKEYADMILKNRFLLILEKIGSNRLCSVLVFFTELKKRCF